MTHDCTHHGHVWAEGLRPKRRHANPTLFVRHRGRKPGKVPVHCVHCKANAELEGHAAFSGPRHGRPVDHSIPPQFKKVLDRAVADSQTDGPVPKKP